MRVEANQEIGAVQPTGSDACGLSYFPLYHACQMGDHTMNGDNADDPVVSSSGYTKLVIVSFVIGGLIEKYVFNHQPPVTELFAIVFLCLLFDALNGIRNRVKMVEGKLDAILKKLNKD
jgi:hypothetical protein